MIRIAIGCCVGFAALIAYLGYAFVLKKRRNRARNMRSSRHNRCSQGRRRLSNGNNNSINNPTNFDNSEPPPSKLILYTFIDILIFI